MPNYDSDWDTFQLDNRELSGITLENDPFNELGYTPIGTTIDDVAYMDKQYSEPVPASFNTDLSNVNGRYYDPYTGDTASYSGGNWVNHPNDRVASTQPPGYNNPFVDPGYAADVALNRYMNSAQAESARVENARASQWEANRQEGLRKYQYELDRQEGLRRWYNTRR